ncbi:MAG: VCBS repeat-containing protein, partial [Gemmatimonadaceae bacterium]
MIRRILAIIALAALPPLLGAQGGPRFVRRVSPFPVVEADGKPMAQPFLGGFDVPRPQLVDIDGDGDLDLFVQERSNEVMFFENVGGQYTWRTDRFEGLTVGEWYRFTDLDGDGVIDLLSESPTSYIRAWRNVGTKTAAKFVVAEDSLRDGDGQPLAADRQNILNVVDIDCNGKLDLFIGRVAGTVDRFEALPGLTPNGIPRFSLHTERFEGIEILGPIPGVPLDTGEYAGGSMHGANTIAFGDIDGDKDIDLFWGDYFEQGLLWIENRSTGCTVPAMRGERRRFPLAAPVLTSGYNAPTIGDADGNGLPDVIVGVIGGAFGPRQTSIDNLLLISQVARGQFELKTRRLIRTIDVGNESVPALADIDGDGDLDLLVGNKIAPDEEGTGTITWFENTGTTKAPAFRERATLPLRGEYHYAPTVADLDGDGRPDLVVGTWRDRVQWWRNTGTTTAPVWTLADSVLVTLTRGSNTAPALADLDGDGDLDMIVGEASGELNLYRNVGSKSAPKFELVSDKFQRIDVGRRSAPALADVDGDGRPDLLLGSEDGGVQLWRNTSTAAGLAFVRDTGFVLESDPYSSVSLGDIDGDGDLDLVVGAISGGLLWFENIGVG